MGKGVDKLTRHFGPHPVPPLLTALHAFSKQARGRFFSGNFELSDFDGKGSAHEFAAHVDGGLAAVGAEVTAKLVLFAQESDGSTYGLWLSSGKSLERAPVVFLCSEGDADAVVANHLREFLALLRLDLHELGRFYAVAREAGAEPSPAHEAYLRWADAHGVPPAPKSAKATVKAAQKKHAGFKRWLNGLRKKLFPEQSKAALPTAKVEIPDCGVLAFELKTTPTELEARTAKLLAGLNRRSRATSRLRLGLTEVEKSDFHVTGRFPPNIAVAVELRSEWQVSTNPVNKRVLILEPPRKSRKHWEVSLWIWPFPSQDDGAAADLRLFDACMGAAGKVLKRRGNASELA
jgi:hypothetical protein